MKQIGDVPRVRCFVNGPKITCLNRNMKWFNEMKTSIKTFFSFCAIQRVLWKCNKTVCVVLLWFQKDGMYIKKRYHISWKMNILKNKDIREILLYKCVLVLCGEKENREKYVFFLQNKLETSDGEQWHLFRSQIFLKWWQCGQKR